MKELTEGEFLKATAIIQFIYIAVINGYPVPSKLYENGYKLHPEYFV